MSSVSFSPNNQYVVSGSSDKTIRIWSVESGDCIKTLEGHTYGVNSVSFSPNNQYVLSKGEYFFTRSEKRIWKEGFAFLYGLDHYIIDKDRGRLLTRASRNSGCKIALVHHRMDAPNFSDEDKPKILKDLCCFLCCFLRRDLCSSLCSYVF